MKILHLTLKKKWFDMIKSGEKKEEYREIKPYWTKRFGDFLKVNQFDAILFKNGYSKTSPSVLVECIGIDFGKGKKEWGANEGVEYYILSLGDIIN